MTMIYQIFYRKANDINMNEMNIDRKEYDKNQMPVWYTKSRYVIYYILGLLEIMLGLRFIFMLLGANPRSGFTSFLYSVSGIFIAPFSGIFSPMSTTGLASRSVFDPAAIIAMLIYALAAWGVVKLLWIKVSKDG